jgi:REP element-mobilizing transposase RayT
MIRAYHVIFTAYGFWLPNDPRGSWSDFVRSWEVYRHGPATKTDTRRSVAGVDHDRAGRLSAKQAMRHRPVRFTGEMARCIGTAFAEVAGRSGYRIHACSIMPDHVHLVVGRHTYRVEQVVRCLKQAATARLRDEGFNIGLPSPWARGVWKVYLNDVEAVRRAIDYVERNPVKAGLRPQRWSCVTPYVE